jgi:hypothetical protein
MDGALAYASGLEHSGDIIESNTVYGMAKVQRDLDI